MEAQVAAAQIGAERYSELLDQYGLDAVTNAYEDLLDYSERLMRDAISKLPNEAYNARTHIDGYLDSDDPIIKDLLIEATLTVKGSEVHVDLTGTAPQTPYKPMIHAARRYSRLRRLADLALDPARQRDLSMGQVDRTAG